ncbi:MAG: copper homeostasis periplasmic binding protein CopC [Sphingopyxis sp.]|uniref:copper homeostasis periplasmic binding protein CopC n=1 Tax=Sphingopyxis sp. TaxID=1908224 RepID=UPI002AB95D41|nr:copper homeostasis periplasmic binding protein CopC [Sphingopyxis sp.]MDZ3831719.1 copper homeostasis periplasmic binding protein CopC [Sphingopyxis sp.]
MIKSLLSPAALTLALLLAPAAQAHVSLAGSKPAANATVSKVTSVALHFSEKLIPATMKVELVMTGMPGMKDHPPMKMPFTSAMGKDGKSMTLQMKRALVPGTYKVKWTAAGTDGHRMGSEFSFTVK